MLLWKVLIVVVETSDTSATLASRQYQYSDESPNKRYPDLATQHKNTHSTAPGVHNATKL